MARRIYIGADRVAVSRPGYDVLTAPRTTDYMAVDSSIDMDRPLLSGTFSAAIRDNYRVDYGTTYSNIPAVELFRVDFVSPSNYSIIKNTIYKQNSPAIRCVPYVIIPDASGFNLNVSISGGGGPLDLYQAYGMLWIYIVWATA